jgi:uncharacterized protein (DUF3820 family)
MVTTRRQSKDFEHVELFFSSPVSNGKRKRTKRPRKVKSTAKTDIAAELAQPTPRQQPAAPSSTGKIPALSKSAERKARRARAKAKKMDATKYGAIQVGAKRSAPVDLTTETDSSDEDPLQPFLNRARLGSDDDDDDADSRYALGPGRKDKRRKPARTMARQTAELKFEEDGLEEVDKANVVVASKGKRTVKQDNRIVSLPSTVKSTNMGGFTPINASRQENSHKVQKKASFTPGAPSRLVMFTVAEAVEALALYKDGTMYGPAAVDPQSRQPYEPVLTGETLSYPVKGTYYLGALGRYGVDTTPALPFALTVPLSEHSMMQTTHPTSTGEPSRRGLGFDTALTLRSKPPAVRRPNNYCLPFGRFCGRRVDSVPISYLQSIYGSDEYYSDTKLLQAVSDLYPNGLYESDAESFTLESGGFKGRRLDEVPKSYVWSLLRQMNQGGAVRKKKEVKTRLERALEAWEMKQLDLTRD